MKLSVLMPAFNEECTIEESVEKVLAQKVSGILEKEIVIVDDCSSDSTKEKIMTLAQKYGDLIKPVFHEKNLGKGGSVRDAIDAMTGDVCIIQDADLEYEPCDYPKVLDPIISGDADCVYGSRFVGSESKRVLFFWHSIGNRVLTLLSNMATNLNLTDMETCYKAFRCEIVKTIPIRCERFGLEPEITA